MGDSADTMYLYGVHNDVESDAMIEKKPEKNKRFVYYQKQKHILSIVFSQHLGTFRCVFCTQEFLIVLL